METAVGEGYLWELAFWYKLCATLNYMNRVQYLHELT
jgi:hypothetical protein